MATFDKSKVICGLNIRQAGVGKKYWCSDHLRSLQHYVETEDLEHVYMLKKIMGPARPGCYFAPFVGPDEVDWEFIYPYDDTLEQEQEQEQEKNRVVVSLKDSVSEFMNQKLNELQNALNITNGDIHFETQVKWDELIEKTTEEWSDMFMEVLKWQKQ